MISKTKTQNFGNKINRELESDFQSKVLKFLNGLEDGWFRKIQASSHQREGIPDVIGCYKGRFYAFELKSKRGQTTAMQDYNLECIKKSGGISMRTKSLDEIKELFKDDKSS